MTETDTKVMDEGVVDAEIVEDEDTSTEDDESMVEDGEEDSSPVESDKPKARSRRGAKAKEASTGKEVVKAPDPVEKPAEGEQSGLTKAQARRLTAKLKMGLSNAADLFIQAYNERIWIALDYETWEDWLGAELGEYRIRIPAVERKAMAASMNAPKSKGGAAMSTRAIASALSVDQKTISSDLRALKVDSERVDGEPEKVVGRDGVEQSAAPRPKPPKVTMLVDQFTTLIVPAQAKMDELLVLTADERWEEEAAEVAKRHRSDLAHMVRTLTAIVKAIPGNSD